MGQHTEFDALDILLDKVTLIENELLFSDNLHSWLKKQSDTDKAVYSDMLFKVSIYRSKLQNDLLSILLEEFGKLEKQLNDAANALQREIKEMKDFVKAMETLGKVLGLVARVVTTAASPSIAPFAVALKAKTSSFSARKAIKAGSVKMQPESSTEDKTPLLLIEEVLYGVELTPEKLIITVATGGCTGEESFRFDVNKGNAGQQPYMVTAYRIEPDDCKGNFEPMKIAFSREELGLDGTVEFILRNRIGNTSNHRLVS